jgi:hypothetical protein
LTINIVDQEEADPPRDTTMLICDLDVIASLNDLFECREKPAKVLVAQIRSKGQPGSKNVDTAVTHDFGQHDDVLMMVYSSSSLELSPEKIYLHLFPEIIFLRIVRKLLVYFPTRMHDSHRLP